MAWWNSDGFGLTFGVLSIVAFLRGQLTYGIARVITEQGLRRTHPRAPWASTVHAWLQGDRLARGTQALHQWGLVVVPLSYLTVGFQTLVLAGAGVIRLRWAWFTLAQVPGAAAWALIYTTIGFAVWQAGLAAAAGSPLALVSFAVITSISAATLIGRRQRARMERTTPTD